MHGVLLKLSFWNVRIFESRLSLSFEILEANSAKKDVKNYIKRL